MPALIAFVLTTSVYGLTTLSASVPRWSVLYLWAGLIVVVYAYRGWGRLDKTDWAALALFFWASISLLWTPDLKQGAYHLTNALSLLIVFLWARGSTWWIPNAALAAMVVCLVMQWLYPGDWGGHGNRNFQTEAIVLLSVLALWKREGAALIGALPIVLIAWAYLLIGNPSKIEFLIMVFCAGYVVVRFCKRKAGTVVQQLAGMARRAAVR